MRKEQRTIFVLLAAWLGCVWVGAAPEKDAGPLDLQALIKRVETFHPRLAELRAEISTAKIRAENADPMRSPEVRLGYSRASDPALRDPYTEVRRETTTEQGTRNTSTSNSRTSSERDSRTNQIREADGDTSSTRETRNTDLTGQGKESGSESYNETVSRTTVREVTPGRRSQTIHQTVTETRSEKFSENTRGSESRSSTEQRNETGSKGTDGRTIRSSSSLSETGRESGNSTTRIMSETLEERFFDSDTTDGSEQYSVEMRFYPRNPWEMRARTRRALAEVSLAEFLYEVEAREIRRQVKIDFAELKIDNVDLKLKQKQVEHLEKTLLLNEELFKVGLMDPDAYSKARLRTLDAKLDVEVRQQSMQKGLNRLATRAHLADADRIDLSGPLVHRVVNLDGLNLDVLTEIALANSGDLGRLVEETLIVEKDLDVNKAGRIPWLSLVSASYDYEERFGDKYQDEYSIVAGFTIPVFAWFGRDDAKEIKHNLSNLQRRRLLLEKRLRLRIELALERLQQTLKAGDDYAGQYFKLKESVQQQLQQLGAAGATARKQRLALEDMLLELDRRGLQVSRDYARELQDFEQLVGVDLDALFKKAPADDAK